MDAIISGEIVPFNAEYAVSNKSFDFSPLKCFKRFARNDYLFFLTQFFGQYHIIHLFLCYICERHVFGLVLGFEGFAAPAWLRGFGLRGIIFVLVIFVIRALMNDGARGWFHNVFVAIVWFYDYNPEYNRFAVDFDDACVIIVGIC
jgi:hypothetical protein